MEVFDMVVLGMLVVVIAVQLFRKSLGALLAGIWCLGCIGWGLYAFQEGAVVRFLSFTVKPVTFTAVLGVMAAYNFWVFWRTRR